MLPIGPFVLCSFGGVSTRLAVSALQCCVVKLYGGCVDPASNLESRSSAHGGLAAIRHTRKLDKTKRGASSFRLRKALNAASRALPASLAAAVGCVRHGCAAA